VLVAQPQRQLESMRVVDLQVDLAEQQLLLELVVEQACRPSRLGNGRRWC
jgi:hypothetical protein